VRTILVVIVVLTLLAALHLRRRPAQSRLQDSTQDEPWRDCYCDGLVSG
jgi:hypothetical protein